MVNPFAKKRVTAEERKAILAEARKTWDSVEHSHVLGVSDVEYLEAIDSGLEVVGSEFTSPEPLTPERSAELSREIKTEGLLSRVFGGRADRADIPSWYQQTHEAEERADMEKLLGPGRRATESLDEMVRKAIDRQMEKSIGGDLPTSGLRIRPIPAREGLIPMLRVAAEEDAESDITKFLRAYIAGDEQAQRRIVRELVAA